jgi:hypothetical protein
MLKGSLSQISLVEVIRLLSSSHQTGLLHLMNMSDTVATGGCYFQLGKWVHATMGRFKGLDALNEICRMSEGTFAFETGVTSAEQTLAQYPTAALIDMVKEQLEEFQALRNAAPHAEDFPKYLPGKTLEGLEATPEDIALLLLCNGERTVLQIAQLSGANLADVRSILAKFALQGLLEVKKGTLSAPEAAPSGASAGAVGAADPPPPTAASPDPAPKPVRYWRGKPVYE